MKAYHWLLTLCLLWTLTSCNNKSLREENDRLKKQNIVLTKVIKKLMVKSKSDSSAKVINEMELEPLTEADFKAGIETFEQDDAVKIPSAWMFENAELLDMMTHQSGNGNNAEGILAYAIEENGELKLGLIPYYHTANELYVIEDPYMAYNFSHMCPPKCPTNNFLNAVHELRQF